jgi:lipoyl(octanoyl) transferase
VSSAAAYNPNCLTVRELGLVDYVPVLQAMQHYTDNRDQHSSDEIWLLQHNPVFTQGQAGKAEHLLATGDIPVVQADRGGQVTYHGPGQLVGYLLIDLKRRKLGVRDLVTSIEQSIVKLLADYQVSAAPRPDAPGVYISEAEGEFAAKIAQLGLRVRRGCSFHGLSLNVDMEMEPFQRINPCGHIGMEVTNMVLQQAEMTSISEVSNKLVQYLMTDLGYISSQRFDDGRFPADQIDD